MKMSQGIFLVVFFLFFGGNEKYFFIFFGVVIIPFGNIERANVWIVMGWLREKRHNKHVECWHATTAIRDGKAQGQRVW